MRKDLSMLAFWSSFKVDGIFGLLSRAGPCGRCCPALSSSSVAILAQALRSSSAGLFCVPCQRYAMAADHPALAASLTGEASAVLVTLGVETVADLANIWTSATEIFDSFSEPRLVESLTAAWRTARVLEGIRLEHLPPLPPLARPAPQPLVIVGAKPKTRCVPPASLLQKPLRVAYGVARPFCLAERTGMIAQLFWKGCSRLKRQLARQMCVLVLNLRCILSGASHRLTGLCSRCLPKLCTHIGVRSSDGPAFIACIARVTALTGSLPRCSFLPFLSMLAQVGLPQLRACFLA